jgi:hypothetical protein
MNIRKNEGKYSEGLSVRDIPRERERLNKEEE